MDVEKIPDKYHPATRKSQKKEEQYFTSDHLLLLSSRLILWDYLTLIRL